MTATASPARPRNRWPAQTLAAVTICYAAALVWATHHPEPRQLLGENPPSDKLMHLCAYGILGALTAATLAAAGRITPRSGLVAAGALAAFGIADEITQPLFNRTADPVDWLVDLVGLTLGIVTVAALAAAARGLRGRRGAWGFPHRQ